MYVAAAPPAHVADTAANAPYRRRLSVNRFFGTGNVEILDRYHADWLVVDRRRFQTKPDDWPLVYEDARYALYHRSDRAMKVLLVTMYFPPAGGGGVQRPLKFATHLPALGIETHVLAPDDPKWLHSDPGLAPPTQAWIHRARYLGPRARRLADELHGRRGLDRLSRQARSLSRRVLVPDENVAWNLTAIPAAVRIVRKHEIDVVLTTSPPNSVHLIGAAVKRATGVRWVADLRDSIASHPHRRVERAAVRAKEKVSESVARLVARQADVIVAASDAIADETLGLEPAGVVTTILNGADFDDFAGLEYQPRRPLPHHAHRQLLRQARPAAVPVGARRVGPATTSSRASSATSASPTASGRSRSGSVTASSCTRTSRGARRSRCSATPRRCCC